MRREHRRELDHDYYGMIHEDHRETANLPQDVVMKDYPKCKYIDDVYLDDTIRGIDEVRRRDDDAVDRHHSDSMY